MKFRNGRFAHVEEFVSVLVMLVTFHYDNYASLVGLVTIESLSTIFTRISRHLSVSFRTFLSEVPTIGVR